MERRVSGRRIEAEEREQAPCVGVGHERAAGEHVEHHIVGRFAADAEQSEQFGAQLGVGDAVGSFGRGVATLHIPTAQRAQGLGFVDVEARRPNQLLQTLRLHDRQRMGVEHALRLQRRERTIHIAPRGVLREHRAHHDLECGVRRPPSGRAQLRGQRAVQRLDVAGCGPAPGLPAIAVRRCHGQRYRRSMRMSETVRRASLSRLSSTTPARSAAGMNVCCLSSET